MGIEPIYSRKLYLTHYDLSHVKGDLTEDVTNNLVKEEGINYQKLKVKGQQNRNENEIHIYSDEI